MASILASTLSNGPASLPGAQPWDMPTRHAAVVASRLAPYFVRFALILIAQANSELSLRRESVTSMEVNSYSASASMNRAPKGEWTSSKLASERASSTAWRWPSIRARPAVLLLGVFVGIGLVQGMTVRLAFMADCASCRWSAPFVGYLTGAIAIWLALPLVQIAVVNTSGSHSGWLRPTALHVAGCASFTIAHLAAMHGLLFVITRLVAVQAPQSSTGFRTYWYVQADLVIYAGLAAFWTLLLVWEERRVAALKAAAAGSTCVSPPRCVGCAARSALSLQCAEHCERRNV